MAHATSQSAPSAPVPSPLDQSAAAQCVVALTASHRAFDSQHEHATRREVARRLARLKGLDFCGEYDIKRSYASRPYYVPSDTLTDTVACNTLGIHSARDLFGGVVPHAFVATKVITHSLIDDAAVRPDGWDPRFGQEVANAVLAGYTAFGQDDARKAGRQLLQGGPVRIKAATATGGRGQIVAGDEAALERALDTLADEIAKGGVVLEENLQNPVTYSIGQVFDGDIVASYHGVQRTTLNNHREDAYGGSDLRFVRGGFDALLMQPLAAEVRLAVLQAQRYHEAVTACFPGFFASRINYDVAQGRAADGRQRSGVLEQSWRLGGATGAEVAALERLHTQPQCNRVHASCFEVYGQWNLPLDAVVYFEGTDAQVGPLAKYTVIDPEPAR
ncbi:DUF3182 family protein [Variovorax sp. J22R133]|uniref:DUF3182 family protein n=1 Tax=Variovorax brevis TaxID=3053503 RepID=UPI002575E2BC|nr:DUF3182 family protein [Variovorax sp. J22R133]MDM0110683.1 DUF3182 family protein [Variovorax sp. J22R133]